MRRFSLTLAFLLLSAPAAAATPTGLGAYAHHASDGRGVVVTSDTGQRTRMTPYGDGIVRVQSAAAGEPGVADDRYGMVLSHAWGGSLAVTDAPDALRLSTSRVRPHEAAVRVS